MKKITIYLMMLFSISAIAQVEVVENFTNAPDFDVPTNWSQTGDFLSVEGFVCGETNKSVVAGFEVAGAATLTTPNYSGITNDTDLTISFSVNVFEQTTFWPPIVYSGPADDWGSLVLEYSLDGGSTWIIAYTVDDSNFTFSSVENCFTIPATNLGTLSAGSDFQARFVATATTIATTKLFIALDDISITQIATTVPNCDTVLLNPINESSNADLNVTLEWQAATGLPTGYTVSVGTTPNGTDIVNEATTATTSYALDGLGLAYETEYFVSIVPFNSIGDATGCTEESFTTRLTPIPGATCSSPLEILSLPYIVANDDTANYENNINVGPCGGYSGAYMSGNDVFYQITPTSDISIDISLANVSEYAAAIHVMEGCPDTATNCVALLGDNYSSEPPYTMELTEVVLLAGHTYFIVLSRASTDGTFSYSMIVTQNDCINPEFTLAPIGDCDSGEFSVNVDVNYLGDASGLTLSDNFGYSDNTISSTGIVNVGPYASGTTVEFTLTNNDSSECSYSDSVFYYCPPSNNDCVNSMALTINTDDSCAIVTSASNAGATESVTNPINCDFTNNNDIWFSFVASKETLIVEYFNIVNAFGDGGIWQSTELLEGSCGAFTSLNCFTDQYITLNNLTIGNTYYIRNSSSSAGEVAQNFDICIKEAPEAPINDACDSAIALTLSTDENCDNQISGTTIGATPSVENTCNDGFSQYWKDVWYTFTATDAGIYNFSFNRDGFEPGANYFIYSGSCGDLVEESPNCYNTEAEAHAMESGETFYILVRSGDNGPGINFDLCVYQLPPAAVNNDCSSPIELVESTDANGDNMITGDFANIYPSSESCASTAKSMWYSFTPNYTGQYTFNLTNVVGYPNYSVFDTDDCTQTSQNYVANSGCYLSGELITDLVAGNTYLISVYSFDNSGAESFTFSVYPDASLSIEANDFETFKYFPNPVVNTLTVDAKNAISKVSVFNIVGQQVQEMTPNSLSTTINMNDLSNGVYFIKVNINESQKTFKVIKK